MWFPPYEVLLLKELVHICRARDLTVSDNASKTSLIGRLKQQERRANSTRLAELRTLGITEEIAAKLRDGDLAKFRAATMEKVSSEVYVF